MLTFDIDAFEERAAIIEFDGGVSRFEAETLAAMAQGATRWQALEAIKCAAQAKSLPITASASDGKAVTRDRSAQPAAHIGKNQKTSVSASVSSRTASSGIAGTAD